MSKFLILGARSPAAFEMATNISDYGHVVHLADSVIFAIANQCESVQAYHRLPEANKSSAEYLNTLKKIIIDNSIDCVIPTCEEVFHLSNVKSALNKLTHIFCNDLAILRMLHSKIDVYDVLPNASILYPKTLRFDSNTKMKGSERKNWVFKKEFSRFGTSTEINVSEPRLKQLNKSVSTATRDGFKNELLIQERIVGTEICCYAIASEGTLKACVCYLPKYRLDESSGIFFESINHSKIGAFVNEMITSCNFHGQVSFDFIQNSTGTYLIECNPRATSGIHFFDTVDLASLINIEKTPALKIEASDSRQLKGAMTFAFFGELFVRRRRALRSDYLKTKDVLETKKSFRMTIVMILAFFEMLWNAIRHRTSIKAASTRDIEWDGGKFK